MPELAKRFAVLAAVLAVLGGLGTIYAQTPPPVELDVTGTVKALLPPVEIDVNETVSVGDSPRVVPPASITITETVGVIDTPNVVPPVSIIVAEVVGVSDATGESATAESVQPTPVPLVVATTAQLATATPAPLEGAAPAPSAEGAPATAPATVSMSAGLSEGFCSIAQWRAGQVLSIYDVMAQTQKRARELADGLSFSLTLDFPDMESLRLSVRSAADAVCSAADPEAAKAALKKLKAVQDANGGTLKGVRDVVQSAMEGAKVTLKAQIKSQMPPLVDEARERMRQEVKNERRSLMAGKTRDPDTDEAPTLTPEEEQQLQDFIARRKEELQAELKAQAARLGEADREQMKAIGELFKDQKNKVQDLADAGKAELDALIQDMKKGQQQVILTAIDAKIKRLTERLESRPAGETQELFLAAIDQARQPLETALAKAFEGKDPQRVQAAMDVFWTSWARATCSTVEPSLQALFDQAQKILEILAGVERPTAVMDAAQEAFTNLLNQVRLAQQTCQNPGGETLKALTTALQETRAAASVARKALEELKAEQAAEKQAGEGG